MKKFMYSLFRAILAIIVVVLIMLFSPGIVNFLIRVGSSIPVIGFIATLVGWAITLTYYGNSMLAYFVIADDDIISTLVGIIMSALSFLLLIITLLNETSTFYFVLLVVGIIYGVAQTVKSVRLRLSGMSISKKNVKAIIREKIIATYLDNFIRMDDGKQIDEWGNNWMQKSFDDCLIFFREIEENLKIKLKFDMIPVMNHLIDDVDNPFMYDAYNVLNYIYFDKELNNKDLQQMRFEIKQEKALRNLSF